MAITKCPYCDGVVSDLAEICPHCEESLIVQEKYSKEIYDMFIKALTDHNFNFEEDLKEGVITARARLDSSLKILITEIFIREDDCYMDCYYENFRISSENVSVVSELLMRINHVKLYPQMILDYNAQDVNGRLYISHIKNEEQAINAFLNIGFHMQDWANAILAVALGLQNPEDAFKSVMDKEDN